MKCGFVLHSGWQAGGMGGIAGLRAEVLLRVWLLGELALGDPYAVEV